ncbi:MAG TPA: cation:proton antiporter [Thermoplasmata archaeon]|nr:cation:proton antiporter [Thermoplasmata archaeon]
MIPPDTLFLALAGIAFLGFVLDALFHRLRVASMLPLMLIGVFLVASGQIPSTTIGLLNSLIPYVSALTVAFILFSVGLEIRMSELSRVVARATAFTFAVQVTTGLLISLLAYELVHWSLLVSLIFGFALSGPSSIAVPALVRVARLPEAMRTSLLYESVISDVLQLLVPILMIGLLVAGNISTIAVASSITWTVLGSAGGGVIAAVVWLFVLDRLQEYAKGYTWTLTITMVLATYGAAERLGLSAAMTIFVFGLTLGNAALLDFRRSREGRAPNGWLAFHWHDLREWLGMSTRGVDVPHILQVQKEVSFFASSFFFVYIGLLFQGGQLTAVLVLVALLASAVMIGCRWIFAPILANCLDPEPRLRRSQRGLLVFNISRGLAAAVVATIPQGMGIIIPGFLDAIFLGIFLSTGLSTLGIFLVYDPDTNPPPEETGESGPSPPAFPVPGRPPPESVSASSTDVTPWGEPPPDDPPPLPRRG